MALISRIWYDIYRTNNGRENWRSSYTVLNSVECGWWNSGKRDMIVIVKQFLIGFDLLSSIVWAGLSVCFTKLSYPFQLQTNVCPLSTILSYKTVLKSLYYIYQDNCSKEKFFRAIDFVSGHILIKRGDNLDSLLKVEETRINIAKIKWQITFDIYWRIFPLVHTSLKNEYPPWIWSLNFNKLFWEWAADQLYIYVDETYHFR